MIWCCATIISLGGSVKCYFLIRFGKSCHLKRILSPSPFQKPFGFDISLFHVLTNLLTYRSEHLLEHLHLEKMSLAGTPLKQKQQFGENIVVFFFSQWFCEKGERMTNQTSDHTGLIIVWFSSPLNWTSYLFPPSMIAVFLLVFFLNPLHSSSSPIHPLLSCLLCKQLPHFLCLAPCWSVVGNIRWLLGK